MVELHNRKISGWGNYPTCKALVIEPKSIDELVEFVKNGESSFLGRGGKTSYGDVSINNDGINIDMTYINKILSFSSETGILHCQSGTKLLDIIKEFHPTGWFLNITPGTQNATVGGCIAVDCHGKNWEAGSFCNYVIGFNILIDNGDIIWCDEDSNSDLYFATLGGIGMTGVIIDVKMYLKTIITSFVNVETIKIKNLEELFRIQEQTMVSHEYLFTWVDARMGGDSLGRGIMQRANYTENDNLFYKSKKYIDIPFYFPNYSVNKYSVKLFNSCYYHFKKESSISKIYFLDFFYPLDGFKNWSRVYGRKGFIEYQIVIPNKNAFRVIEKILKIVSKSQLSSVIAAIKPLTKSKGILSFPIDGITLAIDFAYNKNLFNLLDNLDAIVIENGGRVYLAKDSRLNSENFKKMYGSNLYKWLTIQKKYNTRLSSRMMERFCL